VSKIDHEWAIRQIDAFLRATDDVVPDMSGSGITYFGTVQRGSETEAESLAHIVEQIVERVLPRSGSRPQFASKGKWGHLRGLASRAKITMQREEELRQHLGDAAPEMDAGRLHAWVWGSAASLWRTGHFAQAVGQAAIRINAEAQAKLGRRDISETDLFNQGFSLDAPKAGAPRFRLMENDGSKTYESLHRGARALAEGLYSAIRNVHAHILGETDEQLALEQLASFSLLARWIDRAEVETLA
jgi:hypothetical protein